MTKTRIRVLLVDDHALFREGLASLISVQPDIEVVGEAADGLEALVMARELQPDLILMDVSMPGCDGLEAARGIKEILPGVRIVNSLKPTPRLIPIETAPTIAHPSVSR